MTVERKVPQSPVVVFFVLVIFVNSVFIIRFWHQIEVGEKVTMHTHFSLAQRACQRFRKITGCTD